MNADRHRRALAVVLLVAALRTAWAGASGPPADLLAGEGAHPAPLPDLATSGPLRLSWLPGIGVGRARAIVTARSTLGFPVTPERLALLPGVGEGTAEAIAAWIAADGWRKADGVAEARCAHVEPSPPREAAIGADRMRG